VRHVAIVGGGITGLATAWHLIHGAQAADGVEVTLIESSPHAGGKLRATAFAGHTVDVGAEAFLARTSHTERLARAVGLGDDLVAPATSTVYLWTRGRLRRLPEGTVLGVPTAVWPLLRSGALSTGGALRAGMDLVLPRASWRGDRSVADLVGERFGQEIVDVLVDPLLGGVYAGDPARLSLEATSPLLHAAAQGGRSLLRELRRARRRVTADGPMFLTVEGGMGHLAQRLHDRVADRGDVRLGQPAQRLERGVAGRLRVVLAEGDAVEADHVVLAVPAYVAAELVRDLVPEVAAGLREIAYASVATVSLAYERADVGHPLDGSGMLVPSREGRTVKAATFVSSKWPHQSDPHRVLIRASAGRVGQHMLARSDEELSAAVHRDLAEALDISGEPVSTMVTRWDRALPQYEVGHLDRIAGIRAQLAATDGCQGLHLAGAAYDGVGVASCVARAESLATALTGGGTSSRARVPGEG